MRKLLLLALLLYDVITTVVSAGPGGYDYDEFDGVKRHSYSDGRRNWRKNNEVSQKDWEPERRRHDYDHRYYDELEMRSTARKPDYRRQYDDADRQGPARHELSSGAKSAEHQSFSEKSTAEQTVEKETKSLAMSCDRPHERYEPCFAGCASVTCDNPRDRLKPCYPFCEPGCVCVPPYVRDDRTHKCVLPDECTRGLKGIPDIGDEL